MHHIRWGVVYMVAWLKTWSSPKKWVFDQTPSPWTGWRSSQRGKVLTSSGLCGCCDITVTIGFLYVDIIFKYCTGHKLSSWAHLCFAQIYEMLCHEPVQCVQRLILDFKCVSGVGSDLVCMGEQPLHAAPLFKVNVSIII